MENKKSLYRQYRPKNLDEVAGHDTIKEILISEIRGNSFPHALLFSGQRGTGKTSIAKIVSKIINCSNIQDYNPCENCSSCKEFNQNSHPDIFEMDAASNNGVDEIRSIKINVSTMPVLSKYKVYIIDEVHMLTNSAFNALLKTLEEPPTHVIFILATTEFTKIPETIVSRCQLFNFKAVSKSALENRVKQVCEAENRTINKEALEEIYYMSEGSLRDALNYLEQTMVISNTEITPTEIKKVFYITTKQDKLKLIKNVFSNNAEEIITFFENANDQGVDFQSTNLGIIEIAKELIVYKMTSNSSNLKILKLEEVEEFAGVDLSDLFIFIDNLVETHIAAKNSSINYQYILIKMLKTIKDVGKHISVIKNVEPVIQHQVVETPEVKPQINEQEVVKPEPIFDLKPEPEQTIEPEQIQPTAPSFAQVQNEEQNTEPEIYNYAVDSLEEPKDIFTTQLVAMKTDTEADTLNYKINNETILEVLATASKEERILVEEVFNQVNQNQELREGRVFLPLVNTKIKAANKECFIIVPEVTEMTKWINLKLQNEEYRDELESLFGFRKIIICIDKDQWQQLKKEFMFRKSQNDLSKVCTLTDEKRFYESILVQPEKDEITKKVVSIFGEDIKVVE